MNWLKGADLAAKVKDVSGTSKIILGFSRGKDAVGAAIELRKHFDEVIPVYYDLIPGLGFVNDSLAYYERVLFKRKIHVVPHPNFFRMLRNYLYQDYEAFFAINGIDFPNGSHDRAFEEVRQSICEKEDLPETTFLATGVRAADSVTRRTAIAKHGPLTLSKRTVHLIWDWNKDRLINEMINDRIKLPLDYAMWGRTLDGVDARFMLPLKRDLPEDYEIARRWFPFIEADIIRYSRIRRDQGQEII